MTAIYKYQISILIILVFCGLCSCDSEVTPPGDMMQLTTAKVGSNSILSNSTVESSNEIILGFSHSLDLSTINAINLSGYPNITTDASVMDNDKVIKILLNTSLEEGETYTLSIGKGLMGANGATFEGYEKEFSITSESLTILSVKIGDIEISTNTINKEIPQESTFEILFSHPVTADMLDLEVFLTSNTTHELNISSIDSKTINLTPTINLPSLTKLRLFFSGSIGDEIGRPFESVSYEFYTEIDSTYKFPILDDEALLDLVQKQTLKYFWEFGHPNSGMARERNTSGNLVTSGGSGFGLMAMIVGVERGFITRAEAVDRWIKITDFLETAQRFHGAWSHWMNGNNGTVIPFSSKDNGGDLVETAFLVQGLITVRQYLNANDPIESELIDKINILWSGVEWDWYRKNNENRLFWHWSPEFQWEVNLPISGHNETLMTYILAASSPTHGIPKEVYEEGYAKSGNIVNGNTYYGHILPLGSALGGPLFFTHYSFIGLDPRNLSDTYASYWEQNVNHSKINYEYCIDNPQNYIAYSSDCWGLTASDNHEGYSAHSPTNDKGVITPTAAISSIPYTPSESLDALKFFYYILGDKLWGEYGFYDAFNPTEGWTASSYLAIDQGPIICMIENHRSGLLWDLFMSAPEIQNGLDILGFEY